MSAFGSTDAFKLDKIVFTTPDATFHSLDDAEITANIEVSKEKPAGHMAKTFGAVTKVEPQVRFTTKQLDTLVGAIPAWGGTPAVVVYRKRSGIVGPASRSGTVHNKQTIAASVCAWDTITLPKNGYGSANVTVYAVWNGSANPIVNTGSVALPTTLDITNHFAAGPVTIGATLIEGIQEVTIQSGAKYKSEGDASTVFNTYGEIEDTDAMITIRTLKPINWSTLGITGSGVTSVVGFMKKFSNRASFVDAATEEHVKFSTTSAVAVPMNSQARDTGLWTDTIGIHCLAPDGTTAPLVFELDQAIA